MTPAVLRFGAYRLDLAGEQLWRGRRRIRLTPKTFQLLRHVAERPGDLLTKDALFQALWPGTVVTDAALTRCVRELRRALGDDARRPRFVETVHRRGLRFVAPVAAGPEPATPGAPPAATFVGRLAELAQLHAWLERARRGERQVVFISGETGIGKTTLLGAFLAQLGAGPAIARGRCIEQYGAGEAYLPVLDALEQLCRGADGDATTALLRRHAPSWLVHLPGVLGANERDRLRRQALGATPERMLRELAATLETLTRNRTLVLALEDLQWADAATIALLAAVARRPEPARLLVLATLRPLDPQAAAHALPALKPELALHGLCRELALGPLPDAAVAEYLGVRFVGHRFPPAFSRDLHRRTEGNPLCLVTVVDDLVHQGCILAGSEGWLLRHAADGAALGVPARIRELIEAQRARLSAPEQRLLDVASVAGEAFSAAALGAALACTPAAAELACEALARRGLFLRAGGTAAWPDGTIATEYAFAHALHREVLYERVPAADRLQLHRAIGERLERAYGERAREIAALLAVHFERGHEVERAVRHRQQAGENAAARGASREAIDHLQRGLGLLDAWPEGGDRNDRELALRTVLGPALIAAEGYTAPAVAECFARARVLCEQGGPALRLFPALIGSRSFLLVRGELANARALEERAFALARREENPVLVALAQLAHGTTSFYRGDVGAARVALEQAASLRQVRELYLPVIPHYEMDPIVPCLAYTGLVLWMLGLPDEAVVRGREACRLAEEPLHPASLAFARFCAGCVRQLRREPEAALAEGEAVTALAEAHGFPNFLAFGNVLRGWARARLGEREGGLAELRLGVTSYRRAGAELAATYFLALLAETAADAGHREDACAALDEAEALAERTGERYFAAELSRLRGELDPSADAEACFQRARALAADRQSRTLELRAVTSLVRLWMRRGRRDEARALLDEAATGIVDGAETLDAREAAALRVALGS